MDSELFDRVADFVARETSVKRRRIAPQTLIEDDLGVTGDDAAELMEAFAREFRVDLTGFNFERHFGPERAATPMSLLVGLVRWIGTGQKGIPSALPVTVAHLVGAAEARRWLLNAAAAT